MVFLKLLATALMCSVYNRYENVSILKCKKIIDSFMYNLCIHMGDCGKTLEIKFCVYLYGNIIKI